jgi:hypothetical protein
MGPAADIALMTGTITGLNELIFAPLSGDGKISFNWRIIPATAVFAFLMEGLSKLNEKIALGISVTALITALFGSYGKAKSPVTNLSKALGYG